MAGRWRMKLCACSEHKAIQDSQFYLLISNWRIKSSSDAQIIKIGGEQLITDQSGILITL